MLSTRVIPCLDLRDGRIVKGVRFAGLRDSGDPVERAALYAAQGADEIALLDVTATLESRATAAAIVERIREAVALPLTAGGGVRSVDDAARLLGSGADKVTVNSAAVVRPALLDELAERFGRQCVVLAVDARREGGAWTVLTRSGSRDEAMDAVSWCRRAEELGAGEILLTSFDRDGTREGYDTAPLAAVREAVAVPVIASGGASTPRHMVEAVHAGADAVLAASMFHEGEWTVGDLKRALADEGLEVRR